MTSPSVDASGWFTNGAISTTNSGTVTFSTTSTNCVIYVAIGAEQTSAPSVSTVTATGLTFTKRSSVVTIASGGRTSDVEVWTAPASAAQSSVVITVTWAANVDDACVAVAGIKNCASISSPFDSNGGLPNPQAFNTATETVALSTSQADDFIMAAIGGLQSSIGSLVGFTAQVVSVNNTGGVAAFRLSVFTASVSSTQSGATFGMTGDSVSPRGMIFDAFTADSAGNTGTISQAFSKISMSATLTQQQLGGITQHFGPIHTAGSLQSGNTGTITQHFGGIAELGTLKQLGSAGQTGYTTLWTVSP